MGTIILVPKHFLGEQHKELFSENGAAFGAMPFLRYGYVQNRLEVYKASSIMIYKR